MPYPKLELLGGHPDEAPQQRVPSLRVFAFVVVRRRRDRHVRRGDVRDDDHGTVGEREQSLEPDELFRVYMRVVDLVFEVGDAHVVSRFDAVDLAQRVGPLVVHIEIFERHVEEADRVAIRRDAGEVVDLAVAADEEDVIAEGGTERDAHRPERLGDVDEHDARGDEVRQPVEEGDRPEREQETEDRVDGMRGDAVVVGLRGHGDGNGDVLGEIRRREDSREERRHR